MPAIEPTPVMHPGGWRVEATPDFEAVAGPDWLAAIMTWPVTDRFHAKQNRNIGRLRLTGGGRTVVVYLKRHFERRAGGFGGRSPAFVEYLHLQRARAHGLPVPRAPAVGERTLPDGRRESFLAVEELAGMLALHELVPLAAARLDPATFHAWKRGLAREVGRLIARLHAGRLYHRDLYLCHFYAREGDIDSPPADWAGRVAVIDFHRLVHPRLPNAWLRVKDLAQLLFSGDSVVGLAGRDALRSFASYRRSWPAGGRRYLLPLIQWKAGRYRRHNARPAAAQEGIG